MPVTSFKTFPVLITERLVLRQLKTKDDEAIQAIRSNESVNKYINRPKTVSIEEARDFIKKVNDGIDKHGWFYWAITLKGADKLIGTACYWNFLTGNNSAEIGYELHPAYQGKGIMQEAIIKLIDFGFAELKLETITAYVAPGNEKSIRLLERNNFVKAVQDEHKNDNTEEAPGFDIYVLAKAK